MNVRHLALVCGVIALAGCAVAMSAAQPRAAAPEARGAVIPSAADAGYSIGYDLAADTLLALEADRVDVDADAFIRGFTDAVRNADPALEPGAMRRVLGDLELAVKTRHAEQRLREDPVFRILAEENARRGAEFRTNYAERPEVTALPSGVLVEWITRGQGARINDQTTEVIVDYSGTTVTGIRYAEEYNHRVPMDELFPSFREAMQRLRIGDRVIVVVPPDMAYGIAGRDGVVGPNETLVVNLTVTGVTQ